MTKTTHALRPLLLVTALAVLLTACGGAPPAPNATPIPVPPGWKLTWHDEFDGAAVDKANWTYDLGGGGWGNGEAQNYTSRPENARVENGLLLIDARQEKYEGSYYTSAPAEDPGAASIPIRADRGADQGARRRRPVAGVLDARRGLQWHELARLRRD